MTKRAAVIRRKTEGRLEGYLEVAAAGLLQSYLEEAIWQSTQFWVEVVETWGELLRRKVLAVCPGTRPGCFYGAGLLPPRPLTGKPLGNDVLIVDGVSHWLGSRPFIMGQAQHLVALGELDGRELGRYAKWKRQGFAHTYTTENGVDRGVTLSHGCK